MRTKSEKLKFIESLQETPITSFVCKKLSIPRSNIYRWKAIDLKFRKDYNKALSSGRSNWVDIAEMSLFKNIQGGDFKSAKYFLDHNSKRYSPKVNILTTNKQDQPQIISPIELQPGDTCIYCNQKKPALQTEADKKFLDEVALGYLERRSRLKKEEREKKVGPDHPKPLHIIKQNNL